MTTDKAGNAQLFEGIHSTCRDLARFGVLMLDHGRWGGRQIVSPSWVEAGDRARSSTQLNAGYGYLWWLNHRGVLATRSRRDERCRRAESTTDDGAHGSRPARRTTCTGRSASATS